MNRFNILLFCSSRATLNVTRQAMAEYGYCPSVRLFEAAACGAPLFSDRWEGLDTFFKLEEELLCVRIMQDVLDSLGRSDEELRRMARNARERTLEEHTAEVRVRELEQLCEAASSGAQDASTHPSYPRSEDMWGIIPAAGAGSRMQPLAFSKELLPVGSQIDNGVERPVP